MKTAFNETLPGYEVSTATALFIDALKAYTEAQDKFLEGLTAVYGEKTANDMFNDTYGTQLKAVEDLLSMNLGTSILRHLGDMDCTRKGII